jgi:hypothetical protein
MDPIELYNIESSVYQDFMSTDTSNLTPEQKLAKIAANLQSAGLTPNTPEYEQAFYGVIGSSSISSYDYGSKYSSAAGNQTLKNWMSQNFTREDAAALGVSVVGRIGYSPDVYGWTNEAGQFISPTNPYALDQYGNFVLDETGNKILTPVYAFTQMFEQLYGRKPTAAEIDAGTRDIIASEGYSASGRTAGRLGWGPAKIEDYFSKTGTWNPLIGGRVAGSGSASSSSSGGSGGYKYNPITGQYEPVSVGFGPGSPGYDARKSAYDLLYQQFSEYGLGALVEPLRNLIMEGVSPSEFTLRLRETDAYKKRFAANTQRINKGLRALSEAEYIQLEDQYQNIMRNYGMPASYYSRGDMGIQQGFEKFIANDVSAAELEDRLSTAYNRVINAAPEVSQALRQFYPDISNGDILAYALDPEQALLNIKRKVTAAEIGAGALVAGLETGVSRAEQLQQYGVTGDMARQGYQTIGSYLPRASTLSDIYAKQGLGQYTQTTAEQEVFGLPSSVEAANKRRKLVQLEQAAFSGSSGMAGSALSRDRAGAF